MKSILVDFQRYLLTIKCVAHNTYQAYMADLKQFDTFLLTKKINLERIQSSDLKEFLAHLKKQACSGRSMARKISSLKMFYKWAHEAHGLNDYAQNLMNPKIEKKLPRYLSETEVKELLNYAGQDSSDIGKRNALMLMLLYGGGLRITELINLKISRIDDQASTLIIQGKGNKERIVPIPLPLIQHIHTYLNSVHKKFMRKHGSTDYLFPVMYAGKIKPITRQAYWNCLKALAQKDSIKHTVSPHQQRHSLATHLLAKGADLRSLQMLLGHEDISTVQIYTHVETSHLRDVYDKKHPRAK